MSDLNLSESSSDKGYELETVNCLCCGSPSHEIYMRQAKELYNGIDAWFDVVKCRQCGFVFTNPRPTQKTIGYFYPDSAQYYQPKASKVKGGGLLKKGMKKRMRQAALAHYFNYPFPRLAKFLAFNTRSALYRAHVPRYVENGRLLDIGCAWGGYLWQMQNLGWDVHGIELNKRAAAFARDELGLCNVQCGAFDDIDYPEGYFDCIHMSMVLEHLPDPAGALEKINGLLKAGGQLILSVPDIMGFESRLFKNKSYTLQVPQHLSHFSPQTLSRLLEKSGFDVEKIVHQKTKADFLKSAQYLKSTFVLRVLNHTLVKGAVLGPLTSLLALMGKSSRMSVFAVKGKG